jgi:iron(III) transport system substrate-binding protein
MAMGPLNRRGFSAGAIALMVGTRAFGAEVRDPFAYTGSDRRKFLEDGARREARLMFYSSLIPNLGLKAIVDGFKGKYPYVTIESWRGTEGNIAQKMLAELRSGTVVGDLMEGSELAPLFIKSGLLQKFSSPEIMKTPVEYRDRSGLTAATRFSYYGIAYNTRLVPRGTQPQSFDDLLDPKWKNRLAWRVGSDSGAHMFVANVLVHHGRGQSRCLSQILAAQRVVGFPGARKRSSTA